MKRHPRAIMPDYCDGCEKIIGDLCSVWSNVCQRTGADRGGYIGCPFSPMEKSEEVQGRKRVGQQKQRKS